MDYWMVTRGFTLVGTTQPGVFLAKKEREKKFLLVREDWFTGELRQFTPIVRTEAEALSHLSNTSTLATA